MLKDILAAKAMIKTGQERPQPNVILSIKTTDLAHSLWTPLPSISE